MDDELEITGLSGGIAAGMSSEARFLDSNRSSIAGARGRFSGGIDGMDEDGIGMGRGGAFLIETRRTMSNIRELHIINSDIWRFMSVGMGLAVGLQTIYRAMIIAVEARKVQETALAAAETTASIAAQRWPALAAAAAAAAIAAGSFGGGFVAGYEISRRANLNDPAGRRQIRADIAGSRGGVY